MLTQIINARILTPQGWLKDGSVILRDSKILEVTNCDLAIIGANVIDAKGMYVVPGGIEMHIHGGGGRDALVGIALILTYLAKKGMKTSELRATYPPYQIAKNRIDLTAGTDVDSILEKVKELYKDQEVNDIDGVKIDFPDKWVHLRKSNTEPIIRVYSEASTMEAADQLGKDIMDVVYSMVK